MWLLLLGLFPQTTRILRYEIVWLEVEKNYFILIFILYAN
jgi:hypothetical protein